MDDPGLKPCAIPLWVLARDARYAIAVRVVSTSRYQMLDRGLRPDINLGAPPFYEEQADVVLEQILKGTPPWPLQSRLLARPFAGFIDQTGPHQQASEHLIPGKSYLLFTAGLTSDDSDPQSMKGTSLSASAISGKMYPPTEPNSPEASSRTIL